MDHACRWLMICVICVVAGVVAQQPTARVHGARRPASASSHVRRRPLVHSAPSPHTPRRVCPSPPPAPPSLGISSFHITRSQANATACVSTPSHPLAPAPPLFPLLTLVHPAPPLPLALPPSLPPRSDKSPARRSPGRRPTRRPRASRPRTSASPAPGAGPTGARGTERAVAAPSFRFWGGCGTCRAMPCATYCSVLQRADATCIPLYVRGNKHCMLGRIPDPVSSIGR